MTVWCVTDRGSAFLSSFLFCWTFIAPSTLALHSQLPPQPSRPSAKATPRVRKKSITPLNLPSEQISPLLAALPASDIPTTFLSSPHTLITMLPKLSPRMACLHPPASPSWPNSQPSSFTAHSSPASPPTCPLPNVAAENLLLKAQQKGKTLLWIAVISLSYLSHPPMAHPTSQAHVTV